MPLSTPQSRRVSATGSNPSTLTNASFLLISEAEVRCDKDGIDFFLDCYRPNWIQETARAFAAVGAAEIAAALGAITLDTLPDDPLLDRANKLITSRSGYDYDAIRKVVEQRIAMRRP